MKTITISFSPLQKQQSFEKRAFYQDHPVIILAGVVCFFLFRHDERIYSMSTPTEKENSLLILDFNLKSIGRPACFSAF